MRGHRERVGEAVDDRHGPDERHRHEVKPGRRGEDQRAGHLDGLRRDQEAPPVRAVGGDSGQRREKKRRNRSRESHEPENESGVGQTQHEPALRHDLHPGPDVREKEADPVAAERRVHERSEHPAPRRDEAARRRHPQARPGRLEEGLVGGAALQLLLVAHARERET